MDVHLPDGVRDDTTRSGRPFRRAVKRAASTPIGSAQPSFDRDRPQRDFAKWVEKSLEDLRADALPVTHQIALEAYRLPAPFHRDPADRQIVACARLHEMTVATADERILAWKHVATVDARK
jgi:predicted nucleic acid-binding protein